MSTCWSAEMSVAESRRQPTHHRHRLWNVLQHTLHSQYVLLAVNCRCNCLCSGMPFRMCSQKCFFMPLLWFQKLRQDRKCGVSEIGNECVSFMSFLVCVFGWCVGHVYVSQSRWRHRVNTDYDWFHSVVSFSHSRKHIAGLSLSKGGDKYPRAVIVSWQ